MYEREATAAEMAVFGFTPDDYPDDGVEIYPENLLAINVFISMSTQWRIAMGGATGLDYTALTHVMRLVGVRASEREDTFECVRVMEAEALKVMSEKK